jgi:hypothetical protein
LTPSTFGSACFPPTRSLCFCFSSSRTLSSGACDVAVNH